MPIQYSHIKYTWFCGAKLIILHPTNLSMLSMSMFIYVNANSTKNIPYNFHVVQYSNTANYENNMEYSCSVCDSYNRMKNK